MGESRFLSLAQAGLSYEDYCFDPNIDSWPDFRVGSGITLSNQFDAWCHGAPGIALVRLAAFQIDTNNREMHRIAAEKALMITCKALESLLNENSPNLSVCHGVTGIAEVLQIASEILSEQSYLEYRNRSVDRIFDIVCHSENYFSNSVHRPGFMLGYSGIGYSMLRKQNKNRESVLFGFEIDRSSI